MHGQNMASGKRRDVGPLLPAAGFIQQRIKAPVRVRCPVPVETRFSLPLNVAPVTSVVVTFALLGVLGWSSSGRVICSGARAIRESDFVLQAKALGCAPHRLILRQVLPNLQPVLSAQFWTSIPIFIIAEANLGILGLGVAEPLPSWGNLLRGLENWPEVKASPWKLAPIVALIAVVSCFQLIFQKRENLAS
jgi:peptide/nickel transport system permease protein